MNLVEPLLAASANNPQAAAVSAGAARLTYGELDRLANRIARTLEQLGVGRGGRVAIWAEKSVETVAATQGVLRLGAAYVPVDPLSPPSRALLILRDCAVSAVIGRSSLIASLPEPVVAPCLLTDRLQLDLAAVSPAPFPTPDLRPDDLAFILYTSGTTGVPKGVCLSHRNARAFVDWAVSEVRPTASDVFANHAPFHFDLSVFDLYVSFSVGAEVCLIPESMSYAPAMLNDFVRLHGVTIWYSVPSVLMLMMREGELPECLRTVLFAGEVFPVKHVLQLRSQLPKARLLNLYGPTETNVCTFYELGDRDLLDGQPIPIGKACCGDRVWARKDDGTVAGPGEDGELMVTGPSVMLGYWGNSPRGDAPYATGDRVRLREDGNYLYLGRRDHMVKVRGFRIELGEIEAVLMIHPGVSEAAVTTAGVGIETRLVAFLVCGSQSRPPFLELKRHSAERLPRYMIPDDFRFLDRLPRTRNGKIDRAALSAQLVGQAK